MTLGRALLGAATASGLAFCAYTITVEPPPLWLVGVVLFGYVALVTTGVLVPQLQMFGDVLWRGPAGRSAIALTFDDGPHPVTTRRVLDILGDRGARATFFVIGEKAERHPDVVREIAEAGHDIGIHGYRHDRLYAFKTPNAVRQDIERARKVVEDTTGIRTSLFRPPIGQVSPRTAAGARKAGVTTVGWTVRSRDGLARTRPEDVVRRLEPRLKDGAIVLLHDASERETFVPASIDALPRLLDAVERRQLETAGLSDWIGSRDAVKSAVESSAAPDKR